MVVFACCPPLSLVTSIGSASGASINNTPLFLIAGGSALFTVLGCFLCLVIGGNLLSAVSSCLLSFVAGDIPFSIVFGYFLSFLTIDGH